MVELLTERDMRINDAVAVVVTLVPLLLFAAASVWVGWKYRMRYIKWALLAFAVVSVPATTYYVSHLNTCESVCHCKIDGGCCCGGH